MTTVQLVKVLSLIDHINPLASTFYKQGNLKQNFNFSNCGDISKFMTKQVCLEFTAACFRSCIFLSYKYIKGV